MRPQEAEEVVELLSGGVVVSKTASPLHYSTTQPPHHFFLPSLEIVASL
jgi:hypothetical protein